MKIVSFIPIKLNNQRLPGKNLMELNGRPLCDYIFRTILDVGMIDEKYVYCSDDSVEKYIPPGIVLLKRDACLDGFQVKGMEIIEHFVRDVDADVYVLTHVTQPFTKITSIEKALNKVLEGRYDSAFSAVEIRDYCWYKGKPLNYDMKDIALTQDLEPLYMETGAFFVFKKEVFTKYRQRIGLNPYMHIVDSFEAIDIDTAEDFEMAELAAAHIEKRKHMDTNEKC
jgi:CMP-N-acetylneuraminic acid synthetase